MKTRQAGIHRNDHSEKSRRRPQRRPPADVLERDQTGRRGGQRDRGGRLRGYRSDEQRALEHAGMHERGPCERVQRRHADPRIGQILSFSGEGHAPNEAGSETELSAQCRGLSAAWVTDEAPADFKSGEESRGKITTRGTPKPSAGPGKKPKSPSSRSAFRRAGPRPR